MLPKIINKAELARNLGITRAALNSKIKKVNRNEFSENDRYKAIEVLKNAIKDLDKCK